jgi:hypothetical protein
MHACHRLQRNLHRCRGIVGVGRQPLVAFAAECLRIDVTGGIVAVDAQPMHLTAAHHLLLAHDRNVVLRLARHDAGIAADARVKIDRHAPLMVAVEPRRLVHRIAPRNLRRPFLRRHLLTVFAQDGRRMRLHADGVNVGGIVLVAVRALVVGFANDIAAFHRPVLLGVREFHPLARIGQLRAGRDIHGAARARRIRVKPGAFSHVAGRRATVTE